VISHDISNITESEARYRGLLEAAPDAMVVVNQSGEIVLLNVQAEKQFGYSRNELLGQKVKSIIPVGFAERLIADGIRSPAEALAQQIGMGLELVGLRKDATEFPIEIMLSPLESAEGTLVTAAIRNISVRKEAEKHLARMEGRYRGLLEAAPDAMVVVNQSGEIVLLNVQAEKQFGYSRDELIGQKVKSIIPDGFAERLIADGTRSAAEALAQQIGMGLELVARRKDRSEFPIEIMLSPLESAEGILVTAAIRNISVRKEAEIHLARMEGRYRGLLEAAPDGMVVVNQSGEIVLLNVQAEKQFGYSRDELIGQKVKSIIPDGFAERLIADGIRSPAEALAQQIGTGLELVGLRKDATEFPIEIMLSPLESAEGILVTAAIRDISERKQLTRQLHQSQKMEVIGQLSGGIAHDFNNLLAVIIGNLEFLDSMVATDPAALARVHTALKAAIRGADITRRLLAFSSNEELRPSATSLGESIQNVVEMATRAIGVDITIKTALDKELPLVFVDPAGLESALLNLVVNARDAMPNGGSMTITSELIDLDESFLVIQRSSLKPGRYACVSLTDTGLGMSRETVDHAFEPFFTTKSRGKGTGLGLAMVYGFARQSSGAVHIYSELGFGTKVSIYLPVMATLSQVASVSTKKITLSTSGGIVLVVDDEVDLLEIAVSHLVEMGYTPLKAIDGASALDALNQRKDIEMMMTDIIMPGGMDGVELARQACVLYPDLKIIFMSGFPSKALEAKSMSLVNRPLLHKPYLRASFAAVVHGEMEA
jgi:PAS domain S-box-containing protein